MEEEMSRTHQIKRKRIDTDSMDANEVDSSYVNLLLTFVFDR